MQCLPRLWPLQFAQFEGSAVVPGLGECLGQNCAYGGVNLLTLYIGTTVFELLNKQHTLRERSALCGTATTKKFDRACLHVHASLCCPVSDSHPTASTLVEADFVEL